MEWPFTRWWTFHEPSMEMVLRRCVCPVAARLPCRLGESYRRDGASAARAVRPAWSADCRYWPLPRSAWHASSLDVRPRTAHECFSASRLRGARDLPFASTSYLYRLYAGVRRRVDCRRISQRIVAGFPHRGVGLRVAGPWLRTP